MRNSLFMENNNLESEIILNNRASMIVTGTNKIISLKPELIQLSTTLGDLQIVGNKLELTKLDNINLRAEISGEINSIKYFETKGKQSFIRKIFK